MRQSSLILAVSAMTLTVTAHAETEQVLVSQWQKATLDCRGESGALSDAACNKATALNDKLTGIGCRLHTGKHPFDSKSYWVCHGHRYHW
jgi:hypothetical protein